MKTQAIFLFSFLFAAPQGYAETVYDLDKLFGSTRQEKEKKEEKEKESETIKINPILLDFLKNEGSKGLLGSRPLLGTGNDDDRLLRGLEMLAQRKSPPSQKELESQAMKGFLNILGHKHSDLAGYQEYLRKSGFYAQSGKGGETKIHETFKLWERTNALGILREPTDLLSRAEDTQRFLRLLSLQRELLVSEAQKQVLVKHGVGSLTQQELEERIRLAKAGDKTLYRGDLVTVAELRGIFSRREERLRAEAEIAERDAASEFVPPRNLENTHLRIVAFLDGKARDLEGAMKLDAKGIKAWYQKTFENKRLPNLKGRATLHIEGLENGLVPGDIKGYFEANPRKHGEALMVVYSGHGAYDIEGVPGGYYLALSGGDFKLYDLLDLASDFGSSNTIALVDACATVDKYKPPTRHGVTGPRFPASAACGVMEGSLDEALKKGFLSLPKFIERITEAERYLFNFFFNTAGFMTLHSSEPTEISWSSTEGGIFLKSTLRALSPMAVFGTDTNRDGKIDYNEVANTVGNYAKRIYDEMRTPVLLSYNDEKLTHRRLLRQKDHKPRLSRYYRAKGQKVLVSHSAAQVEPGYVHLFALLMVKDMKGKKINVVARLYNAYTMEAIEWDDGPGGISYQDNFESEWDDAQYNFYTQIPIYRIYAEQELPRFVAIEYRFYHRGELIGKAGTSAVAPVTKEEIWKSPYYKSRLAQEKEWESKNQGRGWGYFHENND